MNFYAYVNNNPIELKDPQGLILPLIGLAAGGALKSVGVYTVNSYVFGEDISWGGWSPYSTGHLQALISHNVSIQCVYMYKFNWFHLL